MKHVHAEVIKAWAEDTSVLVQCRFGESTDWRDLDCAEDPVWNPKMQYRIKPQPKAISFHNVYSNGVIGSFRHASRAAADNRAIADKIQQERIAVVEVRDDGTAHLHKVEA